jgi:hypothetical protein
MCLRLYVCMYTYLCTCRMANTGPNKGNKGTVNILSQLAMSRWLALPLSLYTHTQSHTQFIISMYKAAFKPDGWKLKNKSPTSALSFSRARSISLSLSCPLSYCCVCVCVCEREREREKLQGGLQGRWHLPTCIHTSVCVHA